MALVVNGDGNITGLTPGGLPDASITQSDLASGVAGNGPAFLSWASSAQNFTGGTTTKIQLGTEQFDTNSFFDSTTNYRFQPTVAGYYQFNAIARTNNGGAGEWSAMIFKNGSAQAQGSTSAVNSVAINISQVASLLYLNGSTDYVEMYIYTTNNCQLATGQSSLMSGFLARAA